MSKRIRQVLYGLVAALLLGPGNGVWAADMNHGHLEQGGHSLAEKSGLDERPLRQAAARDHSGMHSKAKIEQSGLKGQYGLTPLAAMPPAGRAREAGFDGRYAMEPTSAGYSLATRCAQASRGLIMLDNASWKRCGGKPKDAARGPGYYPAMPPWNKAGTGQTQTMDHSKMKH